MNASIVALSKVVKDKAYNEAREGLTIGSHPVDCLVRITGSIKVGKDGEADVRAGSVDYKKAFATAIALLATKASLKPELVEELIDMAMRQDETAAKLAKELVETIETTEQHITRVTGKKTTRGRITTTLEFEFAVQRESIRPGTRPFIPPQSHMGKTTHSAAIAHG